MRQTLLPSLLLLTFAACAGTPPPRASTPTHDEVAMPPSPAPTAPAAVAEAVNPLLAEWIGPFGGVPAFDAMRLEDLRPAIEAAMAEGLAEIDAIVASPEAPTFENTIEAYERGGRALSRVDVYYSIWSANLSSPEFRALQREIAPRLAEHRSKIGQNAGLFRRIDAVHAAVAAGTITLRPDQRRLVELIHDYFVRGGARLDDAAKKRYAEIDQELAQLQTRFAANVLADEEKYVLFLAPAELGGLPESIQAAAAAAAAAHGKPDGHAILNTRSSMDPFLTYSVERALREKVWRTYYSRGDNGDDNDNNALITRILKLRRERVQLLGYETYADWRLEDRMAKTPAQAMELMKAVWPAATARVREEVADMQAIADAEGAGISIEPWDYRYYAEKVRKAKYDLDSDAVKQYLALDRLRDAMFFVAGEVFGFRFSQVAPGTVPVYHPDVQVWEVTDAASGRHVGLWYLDPYARAGKRSGAWANGYRDHESFDGKVTVLVSNNSNFIVGAAGEPVLVSWDDAQTFFHEFGHALHALSSNAAYPTLDNGVRDYIEFQSQLLERWLLTDAVIDRFLAHHRTGERMPAELVAKIRKASTFNQGFATTEFLASALMDMAFHTADPATLDPKAFERETLAALGMPKELAMRHRPTQFGHVFSSEGYAAGYYGYLWAEVLTSDAAEAFAEAPGGFYDKALAESLVTHLFAPRNAVDPADAYRAFRGRDATIDALMRDRGFPVAEASAAR